MMWICEMNSTVQEAGSCGQVNDCVVATESSIILWRSGTLLISRAGLSALKVVDGIY